MLVFAEYLSSRWDVVQRSWRSNCGVKHETNTDGGWGGGDGERRRQRDVKIGSEYAEDVRSKTEKGRGQEVVRRRIKEEERE